MSLLPVTEALQRDQVKKLREVATWETKALVTAIFAGRLINRNVTMESGMGVTTVDIQLRNGRILCLMENDYMVLRGGYIRLAPPRRNPILSEIYKLLEELNCLGIFIDKITIEF